MDNHSQVQKGHLPRLLLCSVGMLATSFGLFWISFQFEPDSPVEGRPHLLMLGLLAVAFIFYTLATAYTGFFQKRVEASNELAPPAGHARSLSMIVGVGLVCRIILIFSMPIQEVDIYRYIWDGATVAAGQSPYAQAPAEVAMRLTDRNGDKIRWRTGATNFFFHSSQDAGIKILQQELKSDEGLAECFGHVHYAQFSSPYPPISQQIFAASFRLANRASVASQWFYVHLVSMKAMIVFFDLLTAITIILILAHLGLPKIWVVVYWWCPLVLKEFANSGHMDSFAVFFVTLAVLATLKATTIAARSVAAVKDANTAEENSPGGQNRFTATWAIASAVFLSLGVAAKIFPFILFPVWFIALARKSKTAAVLAAIVFFLASAALLWPMLKYTEVGRQIADQTSFLTTPEQINDSGIEAFSKYWEMNDLLFMVTVENLKARTPETTAYPKPWFVLTSERWRTQLAEKWSSDDVEPSRVAFWLTRRLTLALFIAIVALLCIRLIRRPKFSKNPTGIELGEAAFLTLAYFWMLSPTQNPWYWTWSMPLLVLCKNRIWFAISGLTLLYYLRFYFEVEWAGADVFSSGFTGVDFFYFVVPWIEFGPWLLIFIALGISRLWRTPNGSDESLR